MKKHFIFSLISLFTLTELYAQVQIDGAINGSNSQVFGTLALGKQFNNGLGIRLISSFGNFGTRSESRTWGDGQVLKTPYYQEYNDPPSGYYGYEVVGYKTTNQGVGLGFGIGYTWQINERHALWAEAQGQLYLVGDTYERRIVFNAPSHEAYTQKIDFKHRNSSMALILSHVIRINNLFSVYYGMNVTRYWRDVFNEQPTGYRVNEKYAMLGFKPILQLGVRLNLPTQAE